MADFDCLIALLKKFCLVFDSVCVSMLISKLIYEYFMFVMCELCVSQEFVFHVFVKPCTLNC